MKLGLPYPCIGYCIIDKRGYCTACGRPPTLGAPENCAIGQPRAQTAVDAASPSATETASPRPKRS